MIEQPPPTPPPSERPPSEPLPPPGTVRLASIGIFVVAAFLALIVVGAIATQDSLSAALRTTTPELSEAEADSVATVTTVFWVVFGVVGVSLLVLCGVMVRRQRRWARLTATALLAIVLLFFLYAVLAGSPAVQLLFGVAVLLIGGTLFELWRGLSSEYFLTRVK